jgi:hypothetical protein
MSLELGTNAKRQLFDDSYKAAYESAGPDLRQYVTFRQQMGVDTYKFRTVGRGMAQARGAAQSQLNVIGLEHSTKTATLTDWYASELTDIFDQDKTNAPQEVPALAKVLANATKRRETQIVIDAIKTAYLATLPTGNVITEAGSVGLTVAKLLTARAAFKKNDIMETPTLLLTEKQEYDLLQLSAFTSADFAASSGSVTGNIRQGHFGFNYVLIGTGRSEDGLSLIETDDRVIFAFVPSAVGLVCGLNKTEVNYESSVASWRSTAMLRAGAVAIDTLGIVSIECDE